MKLRMYKNQMFKALLWYTDQLTKMHLGQVLTPARLELISRDLVSLQKTQQKVETSAVWHVPVAVWSDVSRNHFEVVVSDESNVLYMDLE